MEVKFPYSATEIQIEYHFVFSILYIFPTFVLWIFY